MSTLSAEDQAELETLTGEILHLVGDYCGRYPAALRAGIQDLLTRRITEATQAYDDQLAAERTHSTDGTAKHDISDCSPDYCGRYPGQRRD